MEEWKTIIIDGEEWNYEVCNLDGKVRNTKTGKMLKPQTRKDGYVHVGLFKHGKQKHFQVHRLVALMFIPNPQNLPQINHIDENPANNCVENLEWCTCEYNINYSQKGGKNSQAKPIRCIETGQVFDSIHTAAEELGVDRRTIIRCLKNSNRTCGGYHWQLI